MEKWILEIDDDTFYLTWQYFGVIFIGALMWSGLPMMVDGVFISMAYCLFLFVNSKIE